MRVLTRPWARVTRPKLFGTIALVAAIFIAIVALGPFWNLNSAPYELGRVAVASKLGVDAESVELKRITPYEFSEGDFSGRALFVLRLRRSQCFTVLAKKQDGRWKVVDLIPRQ